MPVYFHTEGISFLLKNKRKITFWLHDVVKSFDKEIKTLNFIFCNDQYLLSINKSYLNHNYYTDIITFDYSEEHLISGDLFISIDRIKEYSINNNIQFNEEIHRVIVHGVLHLCGFNDKTDKEKKNMRKHENKYLSALTI